jgi:polyisoprenoid-binding protein YceI
MISRKLSIVAAALAYAMLTAAAMAATPTGVADYTLDPSRSSLKFLFKQAGADNQGRFRKFAVNLRFGDTNLNASRMEVSIEVGSLDTGDEERDNVLRGPELFDVARFPKAQFKSTKINRVSAGRYEAVGKLTIRDVTRDVSVPFTFRTATEKNGPSGYMTGRVIIKRLEFGVGQGEWKATDQVANDVAVTFGLRLTPTVATAPK